jgi:heptosyltransferase-2
LGLHLGIALKKKVLGLFGPTPYKEVPFYNRGEAIFTESNLDCMPCFQGKCENEKNCMEEISVEKVYDKIKTRLN